MPSSRLCQTPKFHASPRYQQMPTPRQERSKAASVAVHAAQRLFSDLQGGCQVPMLHTSQTSIGWENATEGRRGHPQQVREMRTSQICGETARFNGWLEVYLIDIHRVGQLRNLAFYALLRRSKKRRDCLVWCVSLSKTEAASIKRLGAAVRRERSALAMTQEELAEAVELHLRTVQKIEAGKINLLITTVQRLQRVLKCSWGKLLD